MALFARGTKTSCRSSEHSLLIRVISFPLSGINYRVNVQSITGYLISLHLRPGKDCDDDNLGD